MKSLANVAVFQLGWLAAVLGAAAGRPFVGPLVVAVLLAVHLRWRGTPGEGRLVVALAGLGTAAESVLAATGLVVYRADPPPDWLCPPWITALWASFATTLRHSLGGLAGRPRAAAAVGAIGGPLAYLAGARVGAVDLVAPTLALGLLAALWATVLAFAAGRR